MTHTTKASLSLSPVPHSTKRMKAAPKCRNEYQRKMQRIYRRNEADERRSLRHSAAMLEAYVTLQKALQMVSWQDTAVALAEETHAAHEEHAALLHQVAHQRALCDAMASFVHSTSPLPDEPQARHLSLEWITQRMYMNTRSVVQGQDDVFARLEMHVPVDLDTVAAAYGRQFLPEPLLEVTDPLQDRITTSGCSATRETLLDDATMRLKEESTDADPLPLPASSSHRHWDFGLGAHAFVTRAFADRNQTTLVVASTPHEHIRGWIVATALDASTTVVQEVWVVRHDVVRSPQAFVQARHAFAQSF
ncbi:hypothetical protein SDRG_08825 [Saprolegnia diclina VS20]|uniref:Uncharacterized protein n=1 Tax=Saprolegnia diclina (strain VS20) TaxID=1156394 RepID=T0RTQ9_SAPDV|nr:hypothetical protein SDRG_08825 [Saprolegnia diclina VS20]EQC33722.1 hypothetical protein SDRG_08825 [Saprolegnia diclina VS20]|eukprot:XP_008612945.1 hypothetical protein SDRG_08825 [Saprolegnia diclina VS20]